MLPCAVMPVGMRPWARLGPLLVGALLIPQQKPTSRQPKASPNQRPPPAHVRPVAPPLPLLVFSPKGKKLTWLPQESATCPLRYAQRRRRAAELEDGKPKPWVAIQVLLSCPKQEKEGGG